MLYENIDAGAGSVRGFNATEHTFPLFDELQLHNRLDYRSRDVSELPAGGFVFAPLACNKGSTTWYNSSEGRFSASGVELDVGHVRGPGVCPRHHLGGRSELNRTR